MVGEQESSKNTVNVRTRDNQRRGEHSLDVLLDVLNKERSSRYAVVQRPLMLLGICVGERLEWLSAIVVAGHWTLCSPSRPPHQRSLQQTGSNKRASE